MSDCPTVRHRAVGWSFTLPRRPWGSPPRAGGHLAVRRVRVAGDERSPAPTSASDDDELVARARNGDELALRQLLERYRRFARAKAHSYFLVGGDREDIVQEGLIGLYKAIRDYVPDHPSSFRSFAELCITRQILTAIKTATRQKHVPLNSYISFERPHSANRGEARTIADLVAVEDDADPLRIVIASDEVRRLQAAFSELLSGLESEVLELYVEGRSYQEIAEVLGRHVKSVDNALQRVKRKLEQHLGV
ncbi:MAG TPA: RNA polymerase sporulation sigma factor SigH [Nitriliruptorales bacterium]|nr:RNA polymerase sporulation sigma factor SigH [Nitriliruptorales bacterium]